jgi:hypothetical protein
MSADRHFHLHDGSVPELLDDDAPDDMPAARSVAVVLLSMMLASVIIMAVLHSNTHRQPSASPDTIELVP